MMDLSGETAQIYDPESGRVTAIPIRELSDAMIAVRIEGIEGIVYVDQTVLRFEKGPVRHEELPEGLADRIEALAAIFADVLPGDSGEWVDDFRRDEHPEEEVIVWETIAHRYLHEVDPDDTLARKRDVLKVLLSCANNSPEVAALTSSCRTLSHDDVVRICSLIADDEEDDE